MPSLIVREIAAEVLSAFNRDLGRIDHRVQIAFRCIEAPDKFRSKKHVRLDERKTRILPDSRIALADGAEQVIRRAWPYRRRDCL